MRSKTQKAVSTILVLCIFVLLVQTADAEVAGPIVGASATPSVFDFPERGHNVKNAGASNPLYTCGLRCSR